MKVNITIYFASYSSEFEIFKIIDFPSKLHSFPETYKYTKIKRLYKAMSICT